ncbi:MAG: hypothetical protein V9H26_05595 [Verrucomicrobiota bacterium]
MNLQPTTLHRAQRLLAAALVIQAFSGGPLVLLRGWSAPTPEPRIEQPSGNGKLLRSEKWQPFDARTTPGDFFVSPAGNDNWSGRLAAPNATNTDGPFATITRAKRAVRELKASVFQPKEKAIDPRYVGTAYPYGKGKDIVVFIRQGFYSLSEPLLFTS